MLSGVLMAPVATMRADDHHDKRYYDRDQKDYHEWNEREDKAYRHWLEEQHRSYRSLDKENAKAQQEYWKWRHHHPEYDRD